MSKLAFCGIDRSRKHRVSQWVNTATLETMFGIEANIEYGKWAHVVEGRRPLLFATRAEANARIRQIAAPESAR